MKLFRYAMLLLVQLSPIFVYANGEADYKCTTEQTSDVTVSGSANLTNGCEMNGINITFVMPANYDAPTTDTTNTDALVIYISNVNFINSYINIIDAHNISDDVTTHMPLLFTMIKSNMTGSSGVVFGSADQLFKLPPLSRISILRCMISVSSTTDNTLIFTFHSLQLVTRSSIEISSNVITMKCEECASMDVFYLPEHTLMYISSGSMFTVRGNNITMNGHRTSEQCQAVWRQSSESHLTISNSSIFTWASNIITMVVYNVTDQMQQFVWTLYSKSSVSISLNSTFGWISNNINMTGYNVNHSVVQSVWSQYSTSHLNISNGSIYTWASNIITMVGYNVTDQLEQCVWTLYSKSSVTVTKNSIHTWISNNINMTGYNVRYDVAQSVWNSGTNSPQTISEFSNYILKSNNITIIGYNLNNPLEQYIWYQSIQSLLTISDSSTCIWSSNSITMVGHNMTDTVYQYVWSQYMESWLIVSRTSTFGWISNSISILGYNVADQVSQYVWYQDSFSLLTLSDFSNYTWSSNSISILGYNLSKKLRQFVWYQDNYSPQSVSKTSKYKWTMNIITMNGYNITDKLVQYIWYQEIASSLTISDSSNYTWSMNSISMDARYVSKMEQHVWYSTALIILSVISQLLIDSNTILLLAWDYTADKAWSHVMAIRTTATGTISKGSSMVWRDNCIGMGHRETDKRHMFGGRWSITGDKSELLLDENYITTTDIYKERDDQTELVWGRTGDTPIMIGGAGKLTIRNTKVNANNALHGSAGSMLWNSSFTSENNVKHIDMIWSVSPAKDGSGSPIPTLDNSNLRQYMCLAIPGLPPTVIPTLPGTIKPLPKQERNNFIVPVLSNLKKKITY